LDLLNENKTKMRTTPSSQAKKPSQFVQVAGLIAYHIKSGIIFSLVVVRDDHGLSKQA